MATPWTEGWEEIALRFRAPPRILVSCDFDGTLAPLAPHPDAVELPSAALHALRELQAASGVTLAIISGRSIADIAPRIPLPDITVAGNHGLEIRGTGFDGPRSQALAFRPSLQGVAFRLREVLGDVPGILIEDKELSLTVHLRNVIPSRLDSVIHFVRDTAAQVEGLKLQEGHMVLEMLPDIGWDKGMAVCQIASRLGLPHSAVFYVGDDTTDESAFAALPGGISVRVGLPRKTFARWTARDPDDVHLLLHRLAGIRHNVSVVSSSGLRGRGNRGAPDSG